MIFAFIFSKLDVSEIDLMFKYAWFLANEQERGAIWECLPSMKPWNDHHGCNIIIFNRKI